ncbi:MAG: galK [Fibrobacteres bacterium]|nr:galK [Fibrobacterota bacterium]
MHNDEIPYEVVAQYRTRFGAEPEYLVRTPGRVNLIGEHTDYNGGWVLPFAIDRSITMAAGEGRGSSAIVALDRDETVEFDSRYLPAPRPGHWSNYPIGVMSEFAAAGSAVPQIRAAFAGSIPQGGGLSSSAALENCMALLLDRIIGTGLPRETLALYSQAAEHHYAGVRCGIMDQFATLLCRRGHGLLLDCRTRAYRQVPLGLRDYRFVLCNSMVKHDLATSGYNDRRRECESALATLRERHPRMVDLRDCTPEYLESSRGRLSDVEYRRVLHQVGENRRVLDAEQALHAGDIPWLGRLMAESHDSLARNFEVSSPEQDFLVSEAMERGGSPGARMTGGGFGGNVICLVSAKRVGDFAISLRESYRRRFGLEAEILECEPSDGAGIEDLAIMEGSGSPSP